MKSNKNILDVFYDKEADVLYISQGSPSAKDETTETEDEIIVRKNATTGKIKGFTIPHFLKRAINRTSHISLPVNLTFS